MNNRAIFCACLFWCSDWSLQSATIRKGNEIENVGTWIISAVSMCEF